MAPSEVCTLQTGAQSAPAAVNTEHNPSMSTPADEHAMDSSDQLEPDFITPGSPSPQATGAQQPPSSPAVEPTAQPQPRPLPIISGVTQPMQPHTPSSIDDLGQMHDFLEVSSFLLHPKELIPSLCLLCSKLSDCPLDQQNVSAADSNSTADSNATAQEASHDLVRDWYFIQGILQ